MTEMGPRCGHAGCQEPAFDPGACFEHSTAPDKWQRMLLGAAGAPVPWSGPNVEVDAAELASVVDQARTAAFSADSVYLRRRFGGRLEEEVGAPARLGAAEPGGPGAVDRGLGRL